MNTDKLDMIALEVAREYFGDTMFRTGVVAAGPESMKNFARRLVARLQQEAEPDAVVVTLAQGRNAGKQVSMLRDLPNGTKLYAIPRVPDGWQLVPKEPTSKMLSAFYCRRDDAWVDAYAAMLAAAPPAQPAQSQVVKDSLTTQQPAQSAEAPAGMVLVPREPTDAMIRAGYAHYESWDYTGPSSVYRAMLAAAPARPVGETIPERMVLVQRPWRIKRLSDMSLEVCFMSCREASQFERDVLAARPVGGEGNDG